MEDTYVFANLKENVITQMKSVVGTTILNKTIAYIYNMPTTSNTKPPIIALEDVIDNGKETIEIGGRHRLTVYYNVWIYAGGCDNELVNERMKETLKGLMYTAFSRKYSIPFLLFDQGGIQSDYYFSTDISIRSSTPSIYSELDAHKCIGELKVSLIY
jgi:hypothetical protein